MDLRAAAAASATTAKIRNLDLGSPDLAVGLTLLLHLILLLLLLRELLLPELLLLLLLRLPTIPRQAPNSFQQGAHD